MFLKNQGKFKNFRRFDGETKCVLTIFCNPFSKIYVVKIVHNERQLLSNIAARQATGLLYLTLRVKTLMITQGYAASFHVRIISSDVSVTVSKRCKTFCLASK